MITTKTDDTQLKKYVELHATTTSELSDISIGECFVRLYNDGTISNSIFVMLDNETSDSAPFSKKKGNFMLAPWCSSALHTNNEVLLRATSCVQIYIPTSAERVLLAPYLT